ncbi:hypothetical protein QR680_008381 [Steinernema hermaphroditum]|uniref:GOLD domain-containing protein n=1 Tax=Steinernema hermaphroditum TaxID=289476 RepID=A0AA39M7Y0_9BILA|nr:hypothetical protein QR680_008381 [Steinernema hermaphroditum]
MNRGQSILLLGLCVALAGVRAIELTFELPDNANQCFYEDLKAGVDTIIEFQVVTGGQYDVDMSLEDPNGKVLYSDTKKQYDSYSWKTEVEGTYKACFSNEFSTFSHKIVYMDWQNAEDAAKAASNAPAMGQMELYANSIGDKLRVIDDYQTHHRLREATARKRAEELNERVFYWSLGQAAVIILVSVLEVVIVRSFFADKRSVTGAY